MNPNSTQTHCLSATTALNLSIDVSNRKYFFSRNPQLPNFWCLSISKINLAHSYAHVTFPRCGNRKVRAFRGVLYITIGHHFQLVEHLFVQFGQNPFQGAISFDNSRVSNSSPVKTTKLFFSNNIWFDAVTAFHETLHERSWTLSNILDFSKAERTMEQGNVVTLSIFELIIIIIGNYRLEFNRNACVETFLSTVFLQNSILEPFSHLWQKLLHCDYISCSFLFLSVVFAFRLDRVRQFLLRIGRK